MTNEAVTFNISRLTEDLLALDPESDWQPKELQEKDGAYRHLRKYLEQILRTLVDVSGADHGYVALSGLMCGFFTPFVAFNRDRESIAATKTFGPSTLIGKHLWSNRPIDVIDFPSGDPDYASTIPVRQKLLIRLLGHGELFGFISLDTSTRCFSKATVDALALVLSQVKWRIAEQTFSLRVRLIAAPFVAESEGVLFEEITKRAVTGFACDGVVLRLFDKRSQTLVTQSIVGDPASDLIEDHRVGEGLCGRVFADDAFGWATAMNIGQADERLGGLALVSSERSRLQLGEINSCILMKLTPEGGKVNPLGTLSCFYRRPHSFSWRDVSLFYAFCSRRRGHHCIAPPNGRAVGQLSQPPTSDCGAHAPGGSSAYRT